MKHVKFVVLSQPRTGSTLICSYLSSHPGVRCLIEPINPRTHSHHMKPVKDSRCLMPERMVQHNIEMAMDHLLAPEAPSDEWVLSKKDGVVASGFKIMAHQVQSLKSEPKFWKYLHDNRIKVILIFRHNIVMQYVSDLIVKETRQCACWGEDPITAKVHVPIDTLEQNIRRIMREKKYLINKSQHLQHKRLRYEQFKNNCKPVENTLEWLIHEKYPVQSRLQKQNPDSLRERVTNFDALAKKLEHLGFAHLVDS